MPNQSPENDHKVAENLPKKPLSPEDFELEETDLVNLDDVKVVAGSLMSQEAPPEGPKELKIRSNNNVSISDFSVSSRKKSSRSAGSPAVVIGDGRDVNERSDFGYKSSKSGFSQNSSPRKPTTLPKAGSAATHNVAPEDQFDVEFGGKTEFTDFTPHSRPPSHGGKLPSEAEEVVHLRPNRASNRTPLSYNPFPSSAEYDTLDTEAEERTEPEAFDVLTSQERARAMAQGNPSASMGTAHGGENVSMEDLILNDHVLQSRYTYGPESIQVGEVVLLFAHDQGGAPVILRHVWNGNSHEMPAEFRERLQLISTIQHPQLISPRSTFVAATGLWVEFARPPGYRLCDVIASHGAQDPTVVESWIAQITDIIATIHTANVAYANLTLDSIWVQENGPLHLEPFDILTFEHRGALGPYGPYELRVTHGQVHLSPATDVYSLAAVALVALTGLPYNPNNLEHLPQQQGEAIRRALLDDPNQRYQSVEAFYEEFERKNSILTFFKGFASLDKRFFLAIGIAFLSVVVLAVVLLSLNKQVPVNHPPVAAVVAGEEPEGAVVPPPGPVKRFSIVKIKTSYVTNPPKQYPEDGSGKIAIKNHSSLQKLEELMKKVDHDPKFQSSKEFSEEAIAVINDFHKDLRRRSISPEEWKIIKKFNSLEGAQKLQEKPSKNLTDDIVTSNLKAFQREYHFLAERDPGSLGQPLLTTAKTWRFRSIATPATPNPNNGSKAKKETK